MNTLIKTVQNNIGLAAFFAVALTVVLVPISAHAADFDTGGSDYIDTYTPADTGGYDYVDSYSPTPVDNSGYDYIDTYTPASSAGYDYIDTYTPSSYSPSYSSGYSGSGYLSSSFTGSGGYTTGGGYFTPSYIQSTPSNSNTNVNTNVIDNGNSCTAVNSCNTNNNTSINAPTTVVTNPAPVYNPPIVYTNPTPVCNTCGCYGYAACVHPIAYNNTPYVSLSAVPYTGLDLGFWGTIAYWSFLVLWCLAAAYLIVVKRVQNRIFRSMKNFLFGTKTSYTTSAVVETPASNFTQADLAALASMLRSTVVEPKAEVVYTAPVAGASTEVDGIDPFIMSQINRVQHA